MPSVRHCVLNCSGGTSFFSFPNAQTDSARRKEWLRLLGVEEPDQKNIFACQKHFSNYMRSKNRLMYNALPDINVCDIVKYGQIFRSKTCSRTSADVIEDIIEYDPEGEEMSEKKDHTYASQIHCVIDDPPKSSILMPDIDPDVAEILDSAGINPYTGCIKTEQLDTSSPVIPIKSIDESSPNATSKRSPVLLFAPSSPEDTCEALEGFQPVSEISPADYSHLLCSEKMPGEYDQEKPLGARVGRWVQTCGRFNDPFTIKLLDQINELKKQLREQEKQIRYSRREEDSLRKYISKYNEKTEKEQILLFCKKLPTEIAISVRKALEKKENDLRKEAKKKEEEIRKEQLKEKAEARKAKKKEQEIRKEQLKEKAEVRKAENIQKRLSMKKPKAEKKRKKLSEEKAEEIRDRSEESQAIFHILADFNYDLSYPGY